ncbi:MAG TPA: NADH-quinone oxidoreductase subunit J [Alphaproteobacteria bacterium]|nr:NADH-quinone oxidoreductase subunit J [Alphaproteobacteria bacterium]HOO50838.1 NADH-quinone oxidoreductase subunit J [Alphaproteobacteria bacterium]
MIGVFAFYLFSFVLLMSALFVISARNPVYSVLFLILAFFNAAGLFVLLGAEFVAMILVIVYVGAVAVLFLFVVMMLDINFSELRKGAMQYVPLGLVLGGVLLAELITLYRAWPPAAMNEGGALDVAEKIDNTKALGNILYTDYVFPFQVSGLILLVAMIGAIVLTLRVRPGVLRQVVGSQVSRKASDILKIERVSRGKGVDHV